MRGYTHELEWVLATIVSAYLHGVCYNV